MQFRVAFDFYFDLAEIKHLALYSTIMAVALFVSLHKDLNKRVSLNYSLFSCPSFYIFCLFDGKAQSRKKGLNLVLCAT